MIKTYITTLLLTLSLSMMAQSVESLSAVDRYKMAVAHRHFSRQNFPKAIDRYEQFYAEDKLSAEYKNEYAIMLLTQREIKKTIEVLQDTSNKAGVELLFQAYLYDEDYTKADVLLQQYPDLTNSTITEAHSLEAYLAACASHYDYKISLANFNSEQMDFAPVVQDDKVYFVSDRGGVATLQGDFNLTGGAYLDVYEVDEDSVQKVSSDINRAFNDGSISFSDDGRVVFVTRNNYSVTNIGNQRDRYNALQIFRSEIDQSGELGKFEMLPFCSDEYSCHDPFIYKDELYFTSDMPGGFGSNDIYKVSLSPSVEVVGEPQNLGSDINTKEHEGFPFVDEAGTLYFASKGFIGFGGFDIYSATKKGAAYTVTNMGHKINTSSDDFSLFIEDEANGYFASNRPGGVGSDDIYKYHIRPAIEYHVQVIDAHSEKRLSDISYRVSHLPDNVVYDEISDSSEFNDFSVFENIDEAQFIVPESEQYLAFNEDLAHEDNLFTIALSPIGIGVYGYVYNKITDERYPSATMKIYHQDTLWAEFSSDEEGSYLHQLDRESDYRVVALVSGFLPSEANITTRGEIQWIEQNLAVAKRITIEGILYDFDKSIITKESKEILDDVVRLMNENPELQIELGSHTDCRGTEKYNEGLAERRSKAAVGYLVSRGVDASRLTAKSYGEYQLLNKCDGSVWCSPEEHHQNRRTEIKIVE